MIALGILALIVWIVTSIGAVLEVSDHAKLCGQDMGPFDVGDWILAVLTVRLGFFVQGLNLLLEIAARKGKR